MRIGLISSQQFNNPYRGQGTSEGAQMRKVIVQLADRWKRRRIDVTIGPDFDFNKDGTRSFKDNVRWENSVGPFDLLLSFHSNAAGDSMVLWGNSTASAKYGKAIMDALNWDNPFTDDFWTYHNRKVSEVADTKSPTVLIELSRHDLERQAAELVRRIADGSLVAHLDRVLSRALGLPMPPPVTGPGSPDRPNNRGETMSTELTPAAIRKAFVDAEPDFDWTGRNARDAAEKATTILSKLDALTATVSEQATGSGPGTPDVGIRGPGAPDQAPSAPAPFTVDLVTVFREVVRQATHEGVLQALTDYEAAREVPSA